MREPGHEDAAVEVVADVDLGVAHADGVGPPERDGAVGATSFVSESARISARHLQRLRGDGSLD